jgi:hypothetical protein
MTGTDPKLPFPLVLGTAGMYWKRTFPIWIRSRSFRSKLGLPNRIILPALAWSDLMSPQVPLDADAYALGVPFRPGGESA